VKAYVINLADRTDRWNSVLKQESEISLEIIRVNAASKFDNNFGGINFVASGVSATWKSHQEAMKLFLQSTDEFGLIMEDDFLLSKRFHKSLGKVLQLEGFDFAQLGFLKPPPFSAASIMISNLSDATLKIILKTFVVLGLSKHKYTERVLLKEQRHVPFDIVCGDIRAGGHAYLVSRDFATACQILNVPPFLSTDGFFMSLSVMRSFKMYRLRKSCVSQTNSPSSVTQRFNLH
jgi:GR25 family glycosyltransferase involved in LPS biosynthesis